MELKYNEDGRGIQITAESIPEEVFLWMLMGKPKESSNYNIVGKMYEIDVDVVMAQGVERQVSYIQIRI